MTEIYSPESPPQKNDFYCPACGISFESNKVLIGHDCEAAQKEVQEYEGMKKEFTTLQMNCKYCIPAEDIELTALRKYILEDGFVLATVAFHIVTLCAQPMVTPSTTTWDFKDRANVPDMVLALLNQPGYLEGIWPSLRIVMGSNKGNSAWCAGIATTLAFFDTVRLLPTLKELQDEEK